MGAQGRPRRLQEGPKCAPGGPRATQGRPLGHKRAKESPRGTQGAPKEIQGSLQRAPRSNKRDPVSPRGAQRVQLSRPGGPGEHFPEKCCKFNGRVARFSENGNIGRRYFDFFRDVRNRLIGFRRISGCPRSASEKKGGRGCILIWSKDKCALGGPRATQGRPRGHKR